MNKTTSAISVADAILPNSILDESCAESFLISSLLPLALVPPRESGVSVTPTKYQQNKISSRKLHPREVYTWSNRINSQCWPVFRPSPRHSHTCLDLQYAAKLAIPRREAPLAMLTMTPAGSVLSDPAIRHIDFLGCWAVIFLMASVPIFQDPVTFTAMIFWNRSSEEILPSEGQIPA